MEDAQVGLIAEDTGHGRDVQTKETTANTCECAYNVGISSDTRVVVLLPNFPIHDGKWWRRKKGRKGTAHTGRSYRLQSLFGGHNKKRRARIRGALTGSYGPCYYYSPFPARSARRARPRRDAWSVRHSTRMLVATGDDNDEKWIRSKKIRGSRHSCIL